MEAEQRQKLAEISNISRNKKLTGILEQRPKFEEKINNLVKTFEPNKSIKKQSENAILDGNDISVCVRVRPLLEHETQANYFKTVFSNQPQVHVAESRISVKGEAKVLKSSYNVDFAFGPENSTEEIYQCVADPVISMGLQGGVSTIFAYGQTASGKTFTISGILELLAQSLMTKKGDDIELFLSIFEILGNDCTDLLSANSKIDIIEDKFGDVNIVNTKEVKIESSEQFLCIVNEAMSHRKTAITFKNDTSSRSHAACKIRVKNLKHKSVEDGKIFVIDLAGSENASDTQFHDKSRAKESQAINKSLMALKDCIRNRALSAINVDKYYHVPYRLSKLTLLLKDAFEVESRRLCKTVVIANVAPSVADCAMTLNTLRYVTPLKIGQSNREKKVPNPENPANWSNEQLRDRIPNLANTKKINLEVFCPFESGMQILRLPEAVFVERVMLACPGWREKCALEFHKNLWKLLIDARTKDRKAKMKLKNGTARKRELELARDIVRVHIFETKKLEEPTTGKSENVDSEKPTQSMIENQKLLKSKDQYF